MVESADPQVFHHKIRVVATSQGWCEERVRSHCEVASEAAKCSDGS